MISRQMAWAGLAAMSLACTPAMAQKAPPTPAESNPVTMHTMQGFPPPPELAVTQARAYMFPWSRWSFAHLRHFYPSANIWAGPAGHASALAEAPRPVTGVTFTASDGKRMTIKDWIDGSYTDGFIVLHDGKIAYEYYAPGMSAHQPHLLMSVSKSILGLVAADLVATGKLDPNAPLTQYLPELKGSGWDDTTVQQTLDMTAAIHFVEQYTNLNDSDIMRYGIATGLMAPPPGYKGATSLYDYLPTIKKDPDHKPGQMFVYRTVDPEVIGWLVQRVTGEPFNELVSKLIWQPMGAEYDAYDLLDPRGMALAGGQINATLRDMARLGQTVLQHGRYNGHQVLDPKVYAGLFTHDYPVKIPASEDRPDYRYHDFWWLTNNADHAIEGWGANGQLLHVNPTTHTVIVMFASRPVADNTRLAETAVSAMAAIDHALAKGAAR